jgi:EpsI family protein
MNTRVPSHHVSVFLLGLTFLGICSVAMRPSLVMTENRLAHLPMQIGTLDGTEVHFEDSVYAVLNADANLLRIYRSPVDEATTLYIGYYGTAKGGRASHLPQFCYTGQGWSIEEWDFVSLDSPSAGQHRINRMIVKKGVQRQLVYFWFQAEATVMATGLEQNWYKFQHRLLHNRNDGTFVRVSMDLPAGKEGQVEGTAKRFSEAVVPLLSTFWPREGPIQS